MPVLSSELFVSILQKTTSGIQLLDHTGKHVRTLSHAEAAACMHTGNFEAVGRASRVRYLRAVRKDAAVPVEAITPQASPADPSFWADRHLWTWSAQDFGKRHYGDVPVALDGLPA